MSGAARGSRSALKVGPVCGVEWGDFRKPWRGALDPYLDGWHSTPCQSLNLASFSL